MSWRKEKSLALEGNRTMICRPSSLYSASQLISDNKKNRKELQTHLQWADCCLRDDSGSK
jgi:hypothetical protein